MSTEHLVEIWEVCSLACLQPSASYTYPSIPSHHRCVLTSTIHTIVDKSKSTFTLKHGTNTHCESFYFCHAVISPLAYLLSVISPPHPLFFLELSKNSHQVCKMCQALLPISLEGHQMTAVTGNRGKEAVQESVIYPGRVFCQLKDSGQNQLTV